MVKNYKRKYKRKQLSKGNIFGKKSAKSQAKQIYALNKKVNYIRKTTSPETKTHKGVVFYFDSYDAGNQVLLPEYHHRFDLYRERILNNDLLQYLRINGDLLRVKNIYLYGYVGLKTWTYLYDQDIGENQHIPVELNIPRDAYFKITVARVIKGGSNFPNRLYEALPNLSANQTAALSEGIPVSYINGPMIQGVSSQIQILAKKVVHITAAKTSKMVKIKLFNSKKCNLNYRISPAGLFSQGEIFVYIDYISPVSLYRTTDVPPRMIAPQIVAQLNYKIAYSDDATEFVDNM